MGTDVSKLVLQTKLWCFFQHLLLDLAHPVTLLPVPMRPRGYPSKCVLHFYSYNNLEKKQKQKAPRMPAAFRLSFKQKKPLLP